MYNIKCQKTWYGNYHSKAGDAIVIYDKRIKPDNSTRIYLYHSQRDEFVEYVESIITKCLFDLNDDEALQAEKDYKHKWLAAITKQGMVVQKEKNIKAIKTKSPIIKKENINWANKAKS
jgi:hypothetical protein